jgi:hypothetical protein
MKIRKKDYDPEDLHFDEEDDEQNFHEKKPSSKVKWVPSKAFWNQHYEPDNFCTFYDIDCTLESAIVKSEDFLAEDIKKPLQLIHPILKQGSTILIRSSNEEDATLFALSAATAPTSKLKKKEIPKIGPLEVKNKFSALYVSGHNPDYYLQQKIELLRNFFGDESEKYFLHILTTNSWVIETGLYLDLFNPHIMKAIFRKMEAPSDDEIGVLILDNVSTLTPGFDGHTKSEFFLFLKWVRLFRSLGKAVVIVDPSTDSDLQGEAFSFEKIVDYVISVSRLKKSKASNEITLEVKLEAARRSLPAKYRKPFTFSIPKKLTQKKQKQQVRSVKAKPVKKNVDHKQTKQPVRTRTAKPKNKKPVISAQKKEPSKPKAGVKRKTSAGKSVKPKYLKAISMLAKTKMVHKEIAEAIGAELSTTYRYKKRAISEGLMLEDKTLTEEGLKFLARHGLGE